MPTYATLTAGSRWLLGLTLGEAAGEITAADLELAEKMAYTRIKNRMARHFDVSTWTTNTPIEVAIAAEALAAAFVMRFKLAQAGATKKNEDPPWKAAEDFADGTLKAAETAQKVTFENDTSQLARFSRHPQVSQPPSLSAGG